MCRLLKRRSDVEKLLKVSEAVIDIREDSGDILIVLNTAVLAIVCLETLLDCEAKQGFDVKHRTQENASSDTGERMYREIIDELRFCKIAFDVRQTGAKLAFKCYKTILEAHEIYDIHYVWNKRAGEENKNAEFVAWSNTKMNANNINKVTRHRYSHTWQRRVHKVVSDAVAKL